MSAKPTHILVILVAVLCLPGCKKPGPQLDQVISAHSNALSNKGWSVIVDAMEFFPESNSFEGRLVAKGKFIALEDLFTLSTRESKTLIKENLVHGGMAGWEFEHITNKTSWGKANFQDRAFTTKVVDKGKTVEFKSTSACTRNVDGWNIEIIGISSEDLIGAPILNFPPRTIVSKSADWERLGQEIKEENNKLYKKLEENAVAIQSKFPLGVPIKGEWANQYSEKVHFTLTPFEYSPIYPLARVTESRETERSIITKYTSGFEILVTREWISTKPKEDYRFVKNDEISIRVIFDENGVTWDPIVLKLALKSVQFGRYQFPLAWRGGRYEAWGSDVWLYTK